MIATTIALAFSIAASAQSAGEPTNGAVLRERGLEHGYNLDYPEALAAFRAAIEIDPDDGTAHRLAAATLWMQMLFEQGAVTVEDYLGRARARVERTPPSPQLAAQFDAHVREAERIAEQRVRRQPRDADAHFDLGAVAALRASYLSTIEGRVRDSIGPGRRAYSAHMRVLALDPTRHDAGLVVGLYRYGVASLPLPLRLLARLAGFGSGRDEGLRLVEQAASHPSPALSIRRGAPANARFSLVLLYSREGRHGDALRVVHELQQQYPRNRLLWMEAARAALRHGKIAEAAAALEEGLRRRDADPRPRALGEDERWRALDAAVRTARSSHVGRGFSPAGSAARPSRANSSAGGLS